MSRNLMGYSVYRSRGIDKKVNSNEGEAVLRVFVAPCDETVFCFDPGFDLAVKPDHARDSANLISSL